MGGGGAIDIVSIYIIAILTFDPVLWNRLALTIQLGTVHGKHPCLTICWFVILFVILLPGLAFFEFEVGGGGV